MNIFHVCDPLYETSLYVGSDDNCGNAVCFRKYSKEITDYIAQLTKSEITTSAERDGKPCLEFFKDGEESGKPHIAAQSSGTRKVRTTDALPQYDQVCYVSYLYSDLAPL